MHSYLLPPGLQKALEEAIAKLEALVADHPDYALAHAGLSVFYGKLNRTDAAVEHARKVCELDADDPFSFMALSLTCQRAGRITSHVRPPGEQLTGAVPSGAEPAVDSPPPAPNLQTQVALAAQ